MSVACFSPQFEPQYLFSTFICFETLPWRWFLEGGRKSFLQQTSSWFRMNLQLRASWGSVSAITSRFPSTANLNFWARWTCHLQKMNKIGEVTLLCGSSIFVPKQSVFSFPICMLRWRFLRISAISFRSLPLTPDWWSFLRSPFIQTEWKAFSKSMEITAPFCLFLLTSWQDNFSRYNNLTVIRCDWKSSCLASIALVILKSSVPSNLASSSRSTFFLQ